MTSVSLLSRQENLPHTRKKENALALQENIDDAYILELLQHKESYEKGFRLLLQNYQSRIYSHVRRMVNSHEDANDIVQNCFVKVYKSIHKFEKKSKLYTWLYRIATNESLTFLEKRKRTSTDSLDSQEATWHQLKADAYFDGNQAQFLLNKAILSLPDKQKAVFNMRYFDEMPYKDISEALETSQGALKASYHHAVKKIEAFVKENSDQKERNI